MANDRRQLNARTVWFNAFQTFSRAAIWALILVLLTMCIGLIGLPQFLHWITWPGRIIVEGRAPSLDWLFARLYFPRVLFFSWLVWTLVLTPVALLSNERRRDLD